MAETKLDIAKHLNEQGDEFLALFLKNLDEVETGLQKENEEMKSQLRGIFYALSNNDRGKYPRGVYEQFHKLQTFLENLE